MKSDEQLLGEVKKNGNISFKTQILSLKKKKNGEKNKPSIYDFLFKKFLLPQCENSPPKKPKHFTIILNCLLIWKISILHILCTKRNFKREGPSTYKIQGLHIVTHGQEINKMYNNGLEQVYKII